MTDATRERGRSTLWTLLIGALATAWLAAGCGPPEARGAPAPVEDMTPAVQQATDSTAVLVASWSEVDPPADLWRYRLVEQGDTVEFAADSSSLAAEIPRRDSVYTETVCVWGVAVRGAEEAEGPEVCGSVDVPARPLEAPGSIDSLDVGVDTATQVSQVPWDTLRLYDLTTGEYVSAASLAPGETGATLTLLGEVDGTEYICATVEGHGQGWWELASTSGGLTLRQDQTTVYWDDRPDCGVEVDVAATPDGAVTLADAPTEEVPIQDGGSPTLVMDPTPAPLRTCVVQGVCRGGS